MPLEFKFDSTLPLLLQRGFGVLTAAEILVEQRRMAEDARFRPGLLQLLDLSAVERIDASYEDLCELSADWQRYPDRLRGIRLAIVAPTDVHFGLGRMYEALCADLPLEVAVFRDEADARQWLELSEEP